MEVHIADDFDGLQWVDIDVHEGQAALMILAAARETSADLIAMATDRWTDLDRWLNGSVVDQVVRDTSVPVLLISPHCTRSWEDDWLLDVLVPLDGSPLAESALQPAAAFAALLESRLILLRAVG